MVGYSGIIEPASDLFLMLSKRIQFERRELHAAIPCFNSNGQ